ncbi:AraC family transcriptional regulator [Pseudomonas sp. SWI6]|uniref:AraC family transcriptional regulator n=1 Tax=Pseudomonas taiwanensis TaxID=470150 RepID=A0ABR6V142_9PSED|nr:MULTISPECIES: AraC family transcriptional regulator [Pseudomonas]AGZ35820.1 AraC family transcriptional regulator [Pseudomonas sp. VLB120]AVD82734.1 AraC family transcriptional regulator [Pseudomonas sp. SWI6]AVD89690.1 AraC family transcriptional regulator [Pseudomonas sp. SWI44]MBC3474226.1 AraC family transcriptional regulator [Pseudomonas taiwanensis]MBC3491863.1 AraC family transcriptional regulator [Pseudomonas taiwanensis]
MRESDSVAVYFLNAMLHALRDRPDERDARLRAVGIDPALLGQPQARVPAKAFAQLWLELIQLLDDEFFRLDSHGMPLGSFALICRGLIQEPNLEKALRQCMANFSLFLRDLHGSLTVRGGRAVISVQSSIVDPLTRVYAEETYLVLMIGLSCWLAGQRIAIDRTELSVARPAQEDDLLLWGPDLRLGSGRTEVEFDSAWLRLPVVQDLAGLKTFLRSAPQGLVIRFRNQNGLVAEVYRHLRARGYGQWPTLAALADQQGISASTFRRQLEREGRSYQQIKDEVRRAMAFERLRDGTLSIAEIAEQAGFQEPSAFHRAFKKWTGQSPGTYRARLAVARTE